MDGEEPFAFPGRGFHLVADKVAEADYFLDRMKALHQASDEFGFNFNAFVSSARSITFVLQAVMHRYPDFDKWYLPQQQRLKDSRLARFFVELRNHLQKVGGAPLFHSGFSTSQGQFEWNVEFIPITELAEVPSGNVIEISEKYFKLVLDVIRQCYRDYWAYVDPRAIFTARGLEVLNWNVEDVEEALGFPRGYTDIPWPEDEKTEERLKVLSRYGGDELVERFFEKYAIAPSDGEDIFHER